MPILWRQRGCCGSLAVTQHCRVGRRLGRLRKVQALSQNVQELPTRPSPHSMKMPPSNRNGWLLTKCPFRQAAVQFLVQDLVCRFLIERLAAVMIAIGIPSVAMFAVPAMVVFNPAATTIPITCKVLLPIMTRRHPASSLVSRTGPVSVVPPVVVAIGIPVAPDPQIASARALGLHSHYAYRRRRTDSHAD